MKPGFVTPWLAVALLAAPATSQVATAEPAGVSVDAAGIMPKLTGRIWGNKWIKAKVEREPDGRYRVQVGMDVHRINIGIPAAPTTKTSIAGTVLLESAFESGPNGFILTGQSRAKHKTYFTITPEGTLRYMMLLRHDGVYELFHYMELAPSDGSGSEEEAIGARFAGKKQMAALEAHLGLPVASFGDLIGGSGKAAVAFAAVAPKTLPVAKQRVTASAASPPMATVAPIGVSAPVDAKRWGMLAQMAGTTWTNSDQVIAIDWLTPNAAMLIKESGLFGESEVLVTPAVDGKRLSYQRNEPGLRARYQGDAVPAGGRFFLASDTVQRVQCKLKKTELMCDGSDASTGKPTPYQAQYTSIRREDAAALIASQPGVFPQRPKGWFHPKLGLFAEMAGARWEMTHSKQSGKWVKTPAAQAADIGAGDANGAAVVHVASTILGKKSLFFRQSTDGQLYATVGLADHKRPEARASVQLVTRDDGRSQYCYPTRHEGTKCDYWSMSHDGQRVLVSGTGYVHVLSRSARPTHTAGKFGLMGTLNELAFQSPSGEIVAYSIYGTPGQAAGGATISFYRNGEVSALCSTTAASDMDCIGYRQDRRGDSSSYKYKSSLSAASDSEFTRAGLTYRMATDGNLTATGNKGTQTIYKRINWGDLRYMEQAKDDNDNIRYAYADRQSRKESSDAFWRGIAAGIADIPNTMRQHAAATSYMAPTDWSARIPSGGAQAGVPGYQSMGTISRVELPRMSLADQYRQDELERFAIREKMYGSGSSAPSSDRPYAKAYEQLDRDRAASAAASQARRAERDATDAAQQRQQQAADSADAARQKAAIDQRIADGETRRRAAANAAARASAARAAAPRPADSVSSSGGLIVRDDRARDEQRAAETSRLAAEGQARATAERARVAAMVAQQDREAAAAAKRNEEARIRALIKCHGSLEAAKKARATCA